MIKGGFDLFEPIILFSLFFLAGYVIPAVDLLDGTNVFLRVRGFAFENQAATMNVALFYVLLGVIFFYIGYYSSFGNALARILPSFEGSWSVVRLRRVVFIYIVLGVSLLAVLVITSGGIAYFISHLYRRLELLSGKYYFAMGALILAAGALVFYTYWLSRKRFMVCFWIFFACVVVSLSLLGSRTSIAVLLFTLITLWHYQRRRVGFVTAAWAVIGMSGIYIAYNMLFKEYFAVGQIFYAPYSHGEAGLLLSLWNRLTAGTLIQLQTFMVMIEKFHNFLLGRSYLSVLVSFIPRVIFPNKPISPAGIFTQGISPELLKAGTSIPPSLMGEFYMNFSLIGVVIGMALFGVFWKTLYIYRRRSSLASNLIYAVTLSFMFPWIRGESYGPVVQYLMLLIPLVVALKYVSCRR